MDHLLDAAVQASLLFMFLAATLTAILIIIKFCCILWEEDTRRAESWMKPALEKWLQSGSRPSRLHRLRWPLNRIFQYVIIRRSFEQDSSTIAELCSIYDACGYIARDLARMRHPFWWVRAEGARCLGQLRARRAKPELLRALKDRRLEVRLMAAWALGRIGDADAIQPSMEALVQDSKLAGMRLSSTVFEIGEKAIEPLMAALEHQDFSVRLLATHLLGELRAGQAVQALLKKLEPCEHLEVRIAACKALGNIGDRKALKPLLEALQDPRWELRAQAAKNLWRVDGASCIPALETALADHEWWVRRNAGEALSRLGPQGIQALKRVYKTSKTADARDMAAQWLDELDLLS